MAWHSAGRCQLARVGRVWSCTAPQLHGTQLEEQGHPFKDQPAEGKLQEQFLSMHKAAVHRKDAVCSPYPFGDKTKS